MTQALLRDEYDAKMTDQKQLIVKLKKKYKAALEEIKDLTAEHEDEKESYVHRPSLPLLPLQCTALLCTLSPLFFLHSLCLSLFSSLSLSLVIVFDLFCLCGCLQLRAG